MVWAVSKMILALGIVFVTLFFFLRLLRRTHMAKGDGTPEAGIKVLTTKPIAPRKYISLVEIGGEILALGVSEAQITLLTKIENKEWIEKLMARPSILTEPLSLFHYLPKKGRWLRSGPLRIFNAK